MYHATPKTSAARSHRTSLRRYCPGGVREDGRACARGNFKLEPREAHQLLQWAPKGDLRRGRQEMEAELAWFGCTFKYDGGYVIEKGRTPAGIMREVRRGEIYGDGREIRRHDLRYSGRNLPLLQRDRVPDRPAHV